MASVEQYFKQYIVKTPLTRLTQIQQKLSDALQESFELRKDILNLEKVSKQPTNKGKIIKRKKPTQAKTIKKKVDIRQLVASATKQIEQQDQQSTNDNLPDELLTYEE